MRFTVSIDPERCVECGPCVESYVYGVLEIIDDLAYPVEPENCKGCKDCLEVRSQGNKRKVLIQKDALHISVKI